MTKEQERIHQILSNGNVELRCIDPSGNIWASVYDDYDFLAQAIRLAHSKRCQIYHTLNPVTNSATNGKLRPYVKTAKDNEIDCYKNILIDIDPPKTDAGATDEGVQDAFQQATDVLDFLKTDAGFSHPTTGFSGNGFHLIYNTYIPVDAKEHVKNLLQSLSARFDMIDTRVFNPSRITRCLGTINRKGGRKSMLLNMSHEITPGKLIVQYSKQITPEKVKPPHWVTPVGEQSSGWVNGGELLNRFMELGLYLMEVEAGKHYVTCPNKHQHSSTTGTDTVIWFDGERASFHCSHDHCANIQIQQAAEMVDLKKASL